VSAEFPELASRNNVLGTLEADLGILFAGSCERDAGLDAGDSVCSFPFPPVILDAFALSSFICTSVFGFDPSVFTLGFFSLASFDITPRFASGFDDDDEPLVVTLGVVPLEGGLTPAAACGTGEGAVVLLYRTLSHAGSVSGIFKVFKASRALRAIAVLSRSVNFHR
jgi:hypothetical protein